MNKHPFLRAVIVGLSLLALAAPVLAATVVVKVNGQPITDIQIAQRAALKKLEKKGGTKEATEELITEAIELQEATRLNFSVGESDIDAAYLDLARQIKVSPSNLDKILTQNGVPIQTLRDRLKASIAWSKVVQTVVNSKISVSEADIDTQARAKLTAANSYDYILKEVIFLMPGGKGNASARTAQANAYRKGFTGCANAVQESLTYTDAAVRDIGRRHATQLEPAVADELSKLSVGGITKPRVMAGGVSMLAICAKESSDDTTFLANQVRQQTGNGALQKEAEKYLADLKAKAQIIRG